MVPWFVVASARRARVCHEGECTSHLLQLVGDHGERSEDAVRGAGDGDDPLWAGAL